MSRRSSFALIVSMAFFQLAAVPAGAVPAEGQKIMIAGPSPHAVEVGKAVARQGGNAVDVAVAIALSLAVTHPYYASLGGGGFALVKTGEKIAALDFRETAPLSATADLYTGRPPKASTDGGLASAIPGIPAGLWELHAKHGRLPWRRLFQGAIRLAEEGFEVSGEWARSTAQTKARFNPAGLMHLFKKSGAPLLPGDRLKQPALARSLRLLAARGPKAFYAGPVARDLVESVRAAGGLWTLKDLEGYRPRWLEPIVTEYAGHRLHLMPPPSSGGVVIAQALRLFDKVKLREKAPLSTDEFHGLAEVMKLSYLGRSELGDPAFTANPIARLLDEARMSELAKRFDVKKATPSASLPKALSPEHEETTHFSVMMANGDAVAMTVTLNGLYGSAVVSQRFGIALNDEMDDFTARPGEPNQYGLIQGEANQIRPGARPLSSMSPTIIEKDGRTVLVIGAPGGPKIISSVLQVSYRAMTQEMDIDQAIQAPRVHHQFLPDSITTDPYKLSPDVIELLRARGHVVQTGSTGRVYGIRRSADGILSGAFDLRGEGAAGGF